MELLEKLQHFKQREDNGILHAKYAHVNEKSSTIYITTSHGTRLKNLIFDNYLIYPGASLSNDLDLKRIMHDLDFIRTKYKLNLVECVIIFGSNDIDKEASRFICPSDFNISDVKNKLLKGGNGFSVDFRDPLRLGHNVNENIRHIFSKFFSNLDIVLDKLNCKHVILTAPGPRYMFGLDDSLKYNFLCNLFNTILYSYCDIKKYVIVNNFVKNWVNGFNTYLNIHSWKERCNVILRYTRYSRYGAVHYSKEKYKEMYEAISRAIHCCKNGFPSSSHTWISEDQTIYTHYISPPPAQSEHLSHNPYPVSLLSCGDVEANPGPHSRSYLQVNFPKSSSTDFPVLSRSILNINDLGERRGKVNFMLGNKGAHIVNGNIYPQLNMPKFISLIFKVIKDANDFKTFSSIVNDNETFWNELAETFETRKMLFFSSKKRLLQRFYYQNKNDIIDAINEKIMNEHGIQVDEGESSEEINNAIKCEIRNDKSADLIGEKMDTKFEAEDDKTKSPKKKSLKKILKTF